MLLEQINKEVQQRFCKIANFVVNSRLRFARNFILTENTRLRSSQPRKAAKRCKKNKSESITENKAFSSVQCYKAYYEKDTLELKINTLKNGKITGSMVMAAFNKPKMDGELSGEFRGDTLFTSYTYFVDGNKKMTYKNPMAFLKRGDELILGNGEIEYALGASYFIEGKPIDFDGMKYKFTTVDCVAK